VIGHPHHIGTESDRDLTARRDVNHSAIMGHFRYDREGRLGQPGGCTTVTGNIRRNDDPMSAAGNAKRPIAITANVRKTRTDKIAEVVARDLVHDLVDRGRQPGDSLESEQAMLDRYDVSRESLREALRLLEVQGLITIRRGPGGGAFVGTVDPSNLGRVASLYYHLAGATYGELFEAYAVAEATLAELAAKNPDAARRRREMEPYLTDPHDEDPEALVARHSSFHSVMSGLAGNRVLQISLMSSGLLVGAHYLALVDVPNESAFVEQDHEAIAHAIVAGRASKARQLMDAHVRHVTKILEADGLHAEALVTWV
jgi:GntR family transcriptional regulator, transcriptional repressor for pyruvate dehydrogenase complex